MRYIRLSPDVHIFIIRMQNRLNKNIYFEIEKQQIFAAKIRWKRIHQKSSEINSNQRSGVKESICATLVPIIIH